jgi:signal transduction histidine kinase
MEGMLVPDREVIWELAETGGDALMSPADLKAILRELISNSVDATPAGGRITIRVRGETLSAPPPGMSPSPRPGRYSVLEVADTGRGIESRDLPRIFEPFFTSKPLHEGRGLGLCVVHGIASSYGGGVRVDTTPGAGTRVGIYVPVTPIETR